MDRNAVEAWVAGYERAWRSEGTDGLGELFGVEVEYLASPWAQPIRGLGELGKFWEEGRDGADEAFVMESEVVAVEGETAVVRVAVEYARDVPWRDLWVLRFGQDGLCRRFEEWPFAPGQEDGQ
ncbi:nuclear transport factor 2 family protein [Nocardia sp. NPDC051030]|uniref:nuclear transport factor 2 family protein n=1 Tax=Nocardia sp. NPDC051030 TaxID=3155162 RepID=UPI00342CC4B1